MEDEIDLRQYLSVLWRRRFAIGAVTLASILAAGLFSFLSPPVYEGKAIVLVTKPSFQVGASPDPTSPGLKIGGVLVSELPTGTLVAFATADAVKRKVVAKVSEGTTRDRRLARKLTAQAVPNTNLIELKVRGDDPTWVARVANQWAEIVTTESEALFSTEAQQSYTFFDSRLNEAKGDLEATEEALRRFSAASKIGELQAHVNAATQQIAAYQSRLIDLSVALQKSETELTQTEAQIQRQPRTLTLSRSITTDPFLHQAASEAANQNFVELSKLKLRTEELNPVYINLDQARANLAIQVAALRAERAKVTQAIAGLSGELSDLRSQLAAQQFLQTQLLRSVDNARQIYGVLVQRREEARVASASRTGSAKLAAEAVAPEDPVAPRKVLNLALAVILGLIVGSVLALVVESLHPSAAAPVSPVTPAIPQTVNPKRFGV